MDEIGRQTLTILHTNDIHSRFGSMPSLAAMIDAERGASKNELLLLDIGDHMDRMAPETEGTMGGANVDVMNLTGYDAITIGNNEGLTFTPEMLQQVYSGLQCPVVCGNVRERATGAIPKWMKEYIILNKNGIRIGILAATAPYTTFYELLGWDVLEPLECLKKQVASIQSEVDVIILMSHLGLATDQALAEELKGIDIILGGHSHHLLEEPLIIRDTALCAAGKHGLQLGKLVVSRLVSDERFQVDYGGCIPLMDELIDENVAAAIHLHRVQAERNMQETVVIMERELSVHYEQESEFGNVLAQAVRNFTGAPASLVNSGQLLGALPSGTISKSMLHRLCPSPINVCTLSLTGAEIRQALEESLLPEFYLRRIMGYGFRGEVLGSLCMDGLEAVYDPAAPDFHKIQQLSIQGEPVHDRELYTIATLDMFTFKIGYESLAQTRNLQYRLPEFIRDLLAVELQRPEALEECSRKRWS